MNTENNDNIIEDYMFKTILKSNNINQEILKIHDIIVNEKISIKDKKIILSLVIGNSINDTESEIKTVIKKIRSDDYKTTGIYFIIFKILEDILNVNDDNSMNIFLNSNNETINYELKILTIEIINIYKELLIGKLRSHKTFSEILSKDYLDDNELQIVVSELLDIDNKILDDSKNIIENYKVKINTIINKEMEKINKIKSISAFPKN